MMTEEAREARRAYKREWAKKNRDRVQEYTRRYWEKKAESAAAESRNEVTTAGQKA